MGAILLIIEGTAVLRWLPIAARFLLEIELGARNRRRAGLPTRNIPLVTCDIVVGICWGAASVVASGGLD